MTWSLTIVSLGSDCTVTRREKDGTAVSALFPKEEAVSLNLPPGSELSVTVMEPGAKALFRILDAHGRQPSGAGLAFTQAGSHLVQGDAATEGVRPIQAAIVLEGPGGGFVMVADDA